MYKAITAKLLIKVKIKFNLKIVKNWWKTIYCFFAFESNKHHALQSAYEKQKQQQKNVFRHVDECIDELCSHWVFHSLSVNSVIMIYRLNIHIYLAQKSPALNDRLLLFFRFLFFLLFRANIWCFRESQMWFGFTWTESHIQTHWIAHGFLRKC